MANVTNRLIEGIIVAVLGLILGYLLGVAMAELVRVLS
jgi:hypothetical protein